MQTSSTSGSAATPNQSLALWREPITTKKFLKEQLFTCYRNNPEIYAKKLAENEENIRTRAVEILMRELPSTSSLFCLATTGSDARCEKMNTRFSPLEIILITAEQEPCESILKGLETIVASHKLFSRTIDVQSLEAPDQFGFFRTTYFPTRALEAQLIYGDRETFQRYREQFVARLPTIHPSSHPTFDRKVLSDALNQVKLVQQNKSQHCQLETGTIFINDKRIKGTKYSHLRAVQYSLDSIVLKALTSRFMTGEALEQMPLPIVQRLSWLHERNLLPWIDAEQLIAIQNAYHGAMLCHQVAQDELESCESTTTSPEELLSLQLTSREDLQAITETLCRYVDGFKEHYPIPFNSP